MSDSWLLKILCLLSSKHKANYHFFSFLFSTGTKPKRSLEVQMICSLFNIMVIYFYETSLLFLTLNYRYILGSTSHSSANLQILFLSIFPNNLQYFVKYSILHRWHDGPRQVSVELSNLTQGCDPSSLLGAMPHVLSVLPRENSQVATFLKDWVLWVNVVLVLKHLGFYIFVVLLNYLCHNYKMGHHFAKT